MNRISARFQSRRRQLLGGLVLVPWIPAARAAQVSIEAGRTAGGNGLLLQQEGVSASAAFAAGLASSSADTLRFDALDRLLFHDLAPFWAHRAVALSGLTDADAYFCIERVALDQGWRAVHVDLSTEADAVWTSKNVCTVSALRGHPSREHPASVSWSRGGGARWVAWSMRPHELLA